MSSGSICRAAKKKRISKGYPLNPNNQTYVPPLRGRTGQEACLPRRAQPLRTDYDDETNPSSQLFKIILRLYGNSVTLARASVWIESRYPRPVPCINSAATRSFAFRMVAKSTRLRSCLKRSALGSNDLQEYVPATAPQLFQSKARFFSA